MVIPICYFYIDKAKQLFEEAISYGYVLSRSIICLLTGAAGNGKTHVKCLLFKKPPPEQRQSTPLMESPIRAISFAKVDTTAEEWHEVNDDEQWKMIGDAVVAGVPLDADTTESPIQPTVIQHIETELAALTSLTAISHPPNPQAHQPQRAMPSLGDVVRFLFKRKATSTASDEKSAESSKVHHPPSANEAAKAIEKLSFLIQKLVSAIAKSPGSRKFLDAKWIYLVDSGGQSQFHDLLPLFLQKPTITVFVAKLSERFDQRPRVEYYDKGKRVGDQYTSLLTHEELLKHSLCAVQSRAFVRGEQQPAAEKLAVVGTHKDREHECSESIADKSFPS